MSLPRAWRSDDRCRALLVVLLAVAAVGALPASALAASPPLASGADPALTRAAETDPMRDVSAIVQFRHGVSEAQGRSLVSAAGGTDVHALPIINGLAARMSARAARSLQRASQVRAVSLNAAVRPRWLVNFDPNKMATSFNQSANAHNLWNQSTGRDVGVAVIDTGIAGGLKDFRESATDPTSRVVASAVVNPEATSASDGYGHGTHVAGIIAGDSGYRDRKTDKLWGQYAGAAPDANLISIKAGDEAGNATVLDVIYGLQFAIDNRERFNIRVVNLSLESASAQSYKTDPLDAAAEAAWFSGIVVVAAAGNRGTSSDAVSHAPGNDPYVISVGAVDDRGTKDNKDDQIPSWSSRGTTQDGFAKPEIYAPGAHIVSLLSPGSAFTALCPGCVVSSDYIRAGGTSMSAPVVSGIIADILAVRSSWTPDMVKGALLNTSRQLKAGGREVNALDAYNASADKLVANRGLVPNTLIDPATGQIDPTRSSWSRSSWRGAPDALTASWARSSWSCDCSLTSTGTIDPSRSSWSRSSWSTSWGL